MKRHIKLQQKDGKIFTEQPIGFLKSNLGSTKNWGAIITKNPNSAWGCDREFIPRSRERGFAYISKNIKKGDRLQFKVELKDKSISPPENELELFCYVLEIYDNYIEILTYSNLNELLDDFKDEDSSSEGE